MDPVGWTSEQATAVAAWVAALASAATFVVLLVTAIYAARQFKETKELRRAQTRPYVVPSIDVEQQTLFMFRVENLGTTPAYNVRIEFDDAPRSEMRDLEDLRLLKEPIPTMPPGQVFRAYWESSLTVFSDEKPYPHPLSYRVRVAYEDLRGHHYGPEEYVLDFRVFHGQATGPKGMRELIGEVEKLVKEHKKWTDGVRGIRVNSMDAVQKERREHRPLHFRGMKDARAKHGLKGAVQYWTDVWRRRHGLWSR